MSEDILKQLREGIRKIHDRASVHGGGEALEGIQKECEELIPGLAKGLEPVSGICASCGKTAELPVRNDEMGGYVCLSCVDAQLRLLQKSTLVGVGDILRVVSAAGKQQTSEELTKKFREAIQSQKAYWEANGLEVSFSAKD